MERSWYEGALPRLDLRGCVGQLLGVAQEPIAPEFSRRVTREYRDPLELIWVRTLESIGFALERSSEVFAATDGQTLTLGAAETLDADDCVAQMAFHELCHSLVAGEAKLHSPDWGMSNTDARDEVQERACLRVQATLADEFGLQEVLAPTTDFREFYDGLGVDPLEGAKADEVALVQAALARVERAPWGPHVRAALNATQLIVEVASRFADEASLYAGFSRAAPKNGSS